MKKISIVTPCYNEEQNVEKLFYAVKEIMDSHPEYRYEHLFIDNASTDGTVEILRLLAAREPNLKVIVNKRNYGFARSQFHGLTQSDGDATVLMVADFQDPPEMIHQFLSRWEEGNPVVIAVKSGSKESVFIYFLRRIYYRLIKWASETRQIENFIGFGLYDKTVVDELRQYSDANPYLRGMVAETAPEIFEIPFVQPLRERGTSNFNFYRMYDLAMTGFVNYSQLPMRIATFLGFATSLASMLAGFTYLILKLIFWNRFPMGMAPALIGMCFFSSVQLIFLGIIGEYIGAILTQVKGRPLVLEKERINFVRIDRKQPHATSPVYDTLENVA